MPQARRQSESNPGTDNFDAEMVEAALVYYRELAPRRANGYIPIEVAAFIAGACWARQVLVGEERRNKLDPLMPSVTGADRDLPYRIACRRTFTGVNIANCH